jgi:preprotein translocase subunit SecF
MFVIKYRIVFFIFSVILILSSIFAMFHYVFNFGIDFKGGSILEVSYPEGRPALEDARKQIDSLNFGGYSIQPIGTSNYVVRTKELTVEEKTTLLNTLSSNGQQKITEQRFNTIGPVVGKELRNKAYMAIALVILCIVLFITFAFRKVSEPVPSWKYGLATIIALAHDVIIPTGAFIYYGKFTGAEIDVLFITALLAILGYSVHDTIVVFDRVRENLRVNREQRIKEGFDTTVGKSVSQTFGRSINTSLTIFIVLLVLYLIGGEATRNFAFILLIGVVIGTYSSIFIASPLLVWMEKMQSRKLAKR